MTPLHGIACFYDVGFGARAVSRKTPIYFIYYYYMIIMLKVSLFQAFGGEEGDTQTRGAGCPQLQPAQNKKQEERNTTKHSSNKGKQQKLKRASRKTAKKEH